MRFSTGYILDPIQTNIESDEEVFKGLLKNRKEAYVLYHIFDGHDIIEYSSIVVHSPIGFEDREEEISSIYGIKPTEIRVRSGFRDLIFKFNSGISKAGANRVSKILEELYGQPTRNCTYYMYDELIVGSTESLLHKIDEAGRYINTKDIISIIDVRNDAALRTANLLDPELVVTNMSGIEIVDKRLGIIIGFGGIVEYVYRKMGSTEATYRFFNEFFDLGFDTSSNSVEKYLSDGISVAGKGITINGYSMGTQDNEGNYVPITDFLINVHYKIIRGDHISYIVSMIKQEGKIEHVEWIDSFSKQRVAEFVSAFGPYHINATENNVRKIHDLISSAKVPQIATYNVYGKVDYNNEKLCIFKDYIYNMTTKRSYPKMEGTEFYFIDEINGILVEGKNGDSMQKNLGDESPSMGNAELVTYKDIQAVTGSVFKGVSSDLIPMTACTWLGHMMFEPEESCPAFFVTGVTGTGKTTYARFLCAIFGINKPMSIEGTTPFPLRLSFTLLSSLPIFLNEFRTKMNAAQEKTQIVKSLFDGTAFKRGKKDMTVESHTFSSYVFIEGEELAESGATRSRGIIHKTSKIERINGIRPDKILQENRGVLSSMINSYLTNASKAKYFDALDEFQDIIPGEEIEPRIYKNIAMMYAGSMAFAPDKKERFLEVCREMLAKQMEDFNRNGTTSEIIDVVGKYISNRYSKIYTSGYNIILPWNQIIDFVNRARITTELKLENYRDHLEGAGLEIGYFEVTDSDDFKKEMLMVDGIKIHISKAPKAFLCSPITYNLFKEYEKNRLQ